MKPKVEQINVNPKWNRRDFTAELRAYASTPKVFHRLYIGRISAAIYLTTPLFGKVFLNYEDAFHHNNLEIYSVRLGSVDGMSAGFLFRSPLTIKCDPYFVLFCRRGTNIIEDIIKGPVPAEKKYVFSNLVFHVHDSGYLITRLEENSVTKMLAN